MSISWLDSLRADAVFGWRQLNKRKATSAAAILSLALAVGACTTAFRLIDAILLRALPVANAERLYSLSRQGIGFDGRPASFDGWAYPSFQRMRAAVKDQAELISVSYAERTDLTYKSDQEMEKAQVQYVSGWMFPAFGLRPAVGRLFTERDDLEPQAHPYAAISQDYWTRRFGRDPNVAGRSFTMGERLYQIVGVVDGPFAGTETGTMTDIFVPSMMHPSVTRPDSTWHRSLVLLKPGVAVEPIRAKLHATSYAFEYERAKGFAGIAQESIARYLAQTVILEPAAAGASGLQQNYRRSLWALGVLVALVLLIACANVANLMTAQATTRAREMALRVSIGAGRWRLIQLLLIEGAWIASLAGALGALFAAWSAPFVVGRINPPDNPARLSLPADWRVFGFELALTFAVTLLFGLAPALRASAVKPAHALKGNDDPHSRRKLMHVLIAAQVAFCFLVIFVSGLFTATFENLSHKPMGFSPERVLALDTVATRAQQPVVWDQLAEHLRTMPGVEKVALAGWPLLTPNGWNGFISVNGGAPGPVLAYFLNVSPGWTDLMKMHLIDGRDFQVNETSPGAAIVNESFVRQFFGDQKPVGQVFTKGKNRDQRYQVVGVVRDAPYRSLREPILPVAFVPFHGVDGKGALNPVRHETIFVRTTASDPLLLASALRQEVPRVRADFRVSNINSQTEINQAQTVRERLLAMLGLFFAAIALLLAGIGLYGVLDYFVVQRRREIGIRIAIGAPAYDIVRRVMVGAMSMVMVGAAAGLMLGMASVRYVDSLLYGVKPTAPGMLAVPAAVILASALLAAIPAVVHAVRIDPVKMLRSE